MTSALPDRSLPEGWRWARLGDVCHAIRGVTFKADQAKTDLSDGFVSCVTTSAVQHRLVWESRRYIPKDCIKSPDQLLRVGDIIVSTANSKALVGKSCLVHELAEECTFGAFVTVIRHNQTVTSDWLIANLNLEESKQYFYETSSNTTNISNLRVSDLLNLPIFVPSLAEQRRIVTRLEEQMAAAEQARRAADRMAEAAHALPSALLREIFPLKGENLPQGWRWVKLGDTAKFVNGMAFKPSDWQPTGLPIVRIQNLTNPNAAYNCFQGNIQDKYLIEDGDLLISWSATLDVFFWVGGRAVLNQHIFKAIPAASLVDKSFLYFMLKISMGTLRDQTHGATMTHVTRPVFEATLVPLPPLDEQQRIVARLEEQMAAAERTQREAKAQVEAMAAISAALLRDAFPARL